MNLGRVLSQTAYVASVTGIDSHGKATYGTPAARKVRVEAKRQAVTTSSGEEAVATTRLWCVEAIALTDRIWLPGEDSTSAEASDTPLTVSSAADFGGGTTLWKVEL